MASFVRRLFGGGGSQAPQSAPKPKPAPAVQTVGAPPASGTPAQPAGGLGGPARPKGRTKYTGTLGLSAEDRSNTALKTLTGM